ncbi:MAG: hypothetical protein C0478_02770 [Planctomyces sp.]|nr:hypothetical protein [Planctomyces sp.]
MLPIPGRYLMVGVLLSLVVWAALTSTPVTNPLDPESVSAQIRLLNNGTAASRRRAAEDLLKAGQAAVPQLVEQIKNDPDHCRPLIHVLSDMTVVNEQESGEAALTAIEELTSHEDKEVSDAAWEALSENYSIRRRRAIDALTRLGAKIDTVAESFASNGSSIEYAVLDEKYTGGREGLKHLKRLNVLHVLYVSEKLGISREELESLRQWYPRLQISTELNGCLGIVGAMPFGSNVMIDRVLPGSPAAKVGLRPGDRILGVDGVEAPTLRQMVATISRHPPGEPVVVTVLRRDEQVLTFRILAGSDFGTGNCQCGEPPAN